MKNPRVIVCILVLSAIVVAAAATSNAQEAQWQVTEVAAIDGFEIPECMVADEASGAIYISNVVTANEGYWVDDGAGYISRLDAKLAVDERKWLDSTDEHPIHAPKGMCILDGKLYFNDNTRLYRCAIGEPGVPEQIPLPRAGKLNDLASDGKAVYVTDTELGCIYRVYPDGTVEELKSPAGVNGVTCHKGRILAVSWTLHEVYELDPEGKEAPKPFGLAEHFTNLDGIEVLDDGTLLVSDFMGNKVCTIGPDGKTVKTIITLETPADIGLDRKRGLLFVPQLVKGQVHIYRLEAR